MSATSNGRGRRGARRTRNNPRKRSQSVGDAIIQGLREAIAFERGELAVKITRRELPAPKVRSQRAYGFDAKRVIRLRSRLGLSQPVFAQVLNVSAETVKKWEQDARRPDGTAVRLLEVAEEHPEWLLQRLREGNGRGKPR